MQIHIPIHASHLDQFLRGDRVVINPNSSALVTIVTAPEDVEVIEMQNYTAVKLRVPPTVK
jgi:hypothetical protein